MNKVKGSGMIILKKILQKNHIDFEQAVLPKLQSESVDSFNNKLAVSWVTIPAEAKGSPIYESACALFPGAPNKALFRLGELTSQEAPWFYQIFFRIPTMEFLFQRLDKLWKSFYDTGTGSYSNLTDHGVTFIISDYPQFPAYMRQYLSGWFKGFMELLGKKVISVIHNDKDPNAWKWKMIW